MKQTPLRFAPQLVPQPRTIEDKLLMGCSTWRDAAKVGIRFSAFLQSEIAEAMGIGESHFSEILNKKSIPPKYFDFDRLEELESYMGNTAISQFFDLQRRKLLHRQNREELSTEQKAAIYDQMAAGGMG